MTRARTAAQAEAAFKECGVHGLSVWSAVGLTASEIVRLARSHDTDEKRYVPHGKMRTTTVGRLRGCGYDLVPDSPEGHYFLTLPTPPSDEDWDALQRVFGEPEETPKR